LHLIPLFIPILIFYTKLQTIKSRKFIIDINFPIIYTLNKIILIGELSMANLIISDLN